MKPCLGVPLLLLFPSTPYLLWKKDIYVVVESDLLLFAVYFCWVFLPWCWTKQERERLINVFRKKEKGKLVFAWCLLDVAWFSLSCCTLISFVSLCVMFFAVFCIFSVVSSFATVSLPAKEPNGKKKPTLLGKGAKGEDVFSQRTHEQKKNIYGQRKKRFMESVLSQRLLWKKKNDRQDNCVKTPTQR